MQLSDTVVVCSSDAAYFPLAKGFMLSILHRGVQAGVDLGFVDIGCDSRCLEWLRSHGISVKHPDQQALGIVAHSAIGYHLAQIVRTFLPQLFPTAEVLIWSDSDAWIQDVSILSFLQTAVRREPDTLFISPEIHYSYTKVNAEPGRRRRELYGYCAPLFGHAVAREFSRRPTLNTGFFAMHCSNPLWSMWQSEITRIYGREFHNLDPAVRHMAEQTALNVLVSPDASVRLLDPLYNYLCLWTLPFRDGNGLVRVGLPPNVPVGVVHLAGGWARRGKRYFENGLLYQSGKYLSATDLDVLFPSTPSQAYR